MTAADWFAKNTTDLEKCRLCLATMPQRVYDAGVTAGLIAPKPNGKDATDDLIEWARVDLEPAIKGELERATPAVLRRDDGVSLFYPRAVNGLHADSGIGKSIVLAFAAAQELNAGRHVAWIDLEDYATTLIERLRTFEVPDDNRIRHLLHYYRPRTPFSDAAVDHLLADISDYDIRTVVIDSVGEAFGLEGIDENKDTDVGPWMRRVARRLADAGPTVVLVDHATKAADNPLHPSGSKRKRAAVTGASYVLEVVRPLTRESGGRLRLVTAKDRHGNFGRGDVAATIDIATYPDGGVSAKVWPPFASDKETPQSRLNIIARAAVRAAKNIGEPVTQNRLSALMNVKAAASLKRAGIEHAVARGALRSEVGPNRATLHVYVRDLNDDEPGTSHECV
jgi:hypothetical protein